MTTSLSSECVSCGACVQACPTATLEEKSVIEIGTPEHSVVTHLRLLRRRLARSRRKCGGEELVRMVPYKDGKANRGHSCVKGRFALGYATHKDRILNPMIREHLFRSVAGGLLGRGAVLLGGEDQGASRRNTAVVRVGGISSSRCTNEEVYVVQKMVRAGFGNNNIDTCARALPLADGATA